MKIRTAVERYITYRQSLGERFTTNASTLRAFCRAVGETIDIRHIVRQQVDSFLWGTGPVTSAWHGKFGALKGLYSYAMSRGLVAFAPLPAEIPKLPPRFVPYVYSRKELRRLVSATDSYQKAFSLIDTDTMRTFILLLYGTGLRGHEALNLNRCDVDFSESILTIRNTKFFKTRLVPFGQDVSRILSAYAEHTRLRHNLCSCEEPFFSMLSGKRVDQHAIEASFRRLRKHASIVRFDNARYQPRLHDLRHTFAVHRLIAWYQDGKDVQVLLPQLSVYLGHVNLAATQVYLTMTPDLLASANRCFERYSLGEIQ